MKFSKKILPFLLAVCALFGTLSLFAACNDEKDPDPLPPGFCTYTVTVTCDDPAVLTKVTVQLLLEEDGSEASEQTPLEEGSVSFTLPATAYTVNIGGAEGYTYPATTLTANRPKATVPLTKEPPVTDRKPVTSFEAPYLGSWVSLALSDGAPAYCIDVERAALYFNDEEMAVETDGGALYFGGFSLAPYAAVSGSLVLSQGEETFYLVPKSGLPRVTPPSSYNGTWVSEDAGLSLMGSTLSVNGTDGYFVAYRERRAARPLPPFSAKSSASSPTTSPRAPFSSKRSPPSPLRRRARASRATPSSSPRSRARMNTACSAPRAKGTAGRRATSF